MAKRPNPRALRAARTYTIEEAAAALGVTTGTVRNWVKAGLPLMKSRRPFLILGDTLRNFLQDRATGAKITLQPDQLYCLTCKAPRTPMGHMVDCIPQTNKTARLMGLCDVCGGTCNRMIGNGQIDQIGRIFSVVMKGGPTAYSDLKATVLLEILRKRFPETWGKNARNTQETFETRNASMEGTASPLTDPNRLRDAKIDELEQRLRTLRARREAEDPKKDGPPDDDEAR